jgi:hypothetical protein
MGIFYIVWNGHGVKIWINFQSNFIDFLAIFDPSKNRIKMASKMAKIDFLMARKWQLKSYPVLDCPTVILWVSEYLLPPLLVFKFMSRQLFFQIISSNLQTLAIRCPTGFSRISSVVIDR